MKHEKWEERASHFFQGRSPEKEAGVNRAYYWHCERDECSFLKKECHLVSKLY